MITTNQVTAMAAMIAAGKRFGDFGPEERDALVRRATLILEGGIPDAPCQEVDADKTELFDRVVQQFKRLHQDSLIVDAILEKARSLGGEDPLSDALVAMDMAKNLLGEKYAQVVDAELTMLVEACLPVALPGESIFETAVRVLNEYAFNKGISGALVTDGVPVVNGQEPGPLQPLFERYGLPRNPEAFADHLKELRLDDLRAIGNDLPISNLHDLDKVELAAEIYLIFDRAFCWSEPVDTEMITVNVEPSEHKSKKAR